MQRTSAAQTSSRISTWAPNLALSIERALNEATRVLRVNPADLASHSRARVIVSDSLSYLATYLRELSGWPSIISSVALSIPRTRLSHKCPKAAFEHTPPAVNHTPRPPTRARRVIHIIDLFPQKPLAPECFQRRPTRCSNSCTYPLPPGVLVSQLFSSTFQFFPLPSL